MILGPALEARDVAAFDEAVVPRYLSFFGAAALGLLLPHPQARVALLGCKTGYAEAALAERLPACHVAGVDPSPHAIEVARDRASRAEGYQATYELAAELPTRLPAGAFSHALALLPIGGPAERAAIFAELHRLLVPGGQAVVAFPVRGSFPELLDMLREFALRRDQPALGIEIDAAAARRPSVESLNEELEAAGLDEIDVAVELVGVTFETGRSFVDDPVTRLAVMPDVLAQIDFPPDFLEEARKYVGEAVGKYWSEGPFELTINVGCASARRV